MKAVQDACDTAVRMTPVLPLTVAVPLFSF
jgi:hypothetical protein